MSHKRNTILKPQRCSSLAGITPHRGELYKRCKAESNNLDVPPEDRSHWALTEPWRHLIRHLSCSLQTISWARLESILGRSLPTQTDRRTLKYDGWREREHKPLSTERDSIYTYNISSERRLVGGAETEHFRETNADRCRAPAAPFSLPDQNVSAAGRVSATVSRSQSFSQCT